MAITDTIPINDALKSLLCAQRQTYTSYMTKMEEQNEKLKGQRIKMEALLLGHSVDISSEIDKCAMFCKEVKKFVLIHELMSIEWDGMHILYDVYNEIRARRQQEIVENMENDIDRARRNLLYERIRMMFRLFRAIKYMDQRRNDCFYERIASFCDPLSDGWVAIDELMKAQENGQ